MLERRVVERRVVIPASPEQLWDALTDPEAVAAWFGAEVEWDLRPGGAARFLEEDGSVRRGRVDAVSPGRELRFRWWPEDETGTGASQVTYTLEPDDAGTRLTVTERPLSARAAVATADAWTVWDSRLLRCWAATAGALVVRAGH